MKTAVLILCLTASATVCAQNYPVRTVRIVVPYSPGGNTDFTARVIDADTGQESYDIKIADLNGDGRPDLLLAGRASHNAAWYLNLPLPAAK